MELERRIDAIVKEAGNIGLQISLEKRKVMHKEDVNSRDDICTGTDCLEVADSFTYLRCTIDSNEVAEYDVRSQTKATTEFWFSTS